MITVPQIMDRGRRACRRGSLSSTAVLCSVINLAVILSQMLSLYPLVTPWRNLGACIVFMELHSQHDASLVA